jgi:anti-sigma-K factor RskA
MSASMHIPHEELTLYAMQALAPGDQSSVKSHLAECDACRAQLAAIMGDLALVSMSAEQHPLPEGARQRFLDRIGAAPTAASNVVSIGNRTSGQAPQAQRSSWIPWTAIAALLLVAAWLGVDLHLANLRLQRQSAQIASELQENQRAREVLDVLTASAAQHVVLTAGSPRPAPSVRVVYLASRGALILQGSNLAQIDPGKTYEFWIIPANGEAPIPAGVFRPDAAGSASLVLPQIPTGVQAKAFGVTVENAGGSSAPTLPIVLSAAAPSIAGE